jgi:phage portal protein BeeE
VQTMRLTASQIASIYGIPPEMIGGETGGSMSYSSPEQRQIELVQFSLLPWLALLESHLSNLLPRGQYVKFDAGRAHAG